MNDTEPNEKKRGRRRRGRKGEGWLEPRGNVWFACAKFKLPGETKAKLRRKSTGFLVKPEEKSKAQEFLRRWTAERRAGKLLPAGSAANPATLADLRETYLADVRNNCPKYERRAGFCLAHIEAHFADCVRAKIDHRGRVLAEAVHRCASKVAAEIDGHAIQGYIEARLASGATAGTINRELSALRRAFKLYARKDKKERRLADSPEIVLLTEDNVRDRVPTAKEVDAVIAQLPDRLKAPIRFASLTGWRIANVLNLQWSRVDEAGGAIRIPARETKGGKRAKKKRDLVLHFSEDPVLAEIIRDRRQATDEYQRTHSAEGIKKAVPYVFWFEGLDEHGHKAAVRNTEYHHAWQRACDRAEIEDLHVHDLRRFFAVNAVKAGVDENTIMRLAGWSTRSMFDRYSVRNEDDCAAAVAKMARARSTERHQDEHRDATAKQA